MLDTSRTPHRRSEFAPGPPVWLLGLLAVGMLVPVTLPVPVLRGLVVDRFAVSELWAAAFMSINMVGAVLAAPLAGAIADRTGRRKPWLVLALLVDGACFLGMVLPLEFAWFLALRLVEGVAHITALSLLLSMAAELARRVGSGRTMGFVGAGITLGVALGAPLGGQLGNLDPLLPLRVGAGLSAGLALVCLVGLRELGGEVARRPGFAEILATLRRERDLWVPWTYAFVDRFTVGFFTTTFTLWMKRVHELEPARIGLLLGLFLGPFSLLSYPFGRLSERWSRSRMLAYGSLVYGLGLMTLGVWSPADLPVVMVALGVVSAVMFVPSLILTTDLADVRIRATALGGFNAAGSLGFIVGPLCGGLISGWVAERRGWDVGYATAFVVAGLAEIACVLLTLRALGRLRRAGRTA